MAAATGVRLKRLVNEMKVAQKEDGQDGVSLRVAPGSEDTLSKFIGTIEGPEDTPFSGIKFDVDITIEAGYPVKPPKMKFMTVPYHPNISSHGSICVTFLKNYCSSGWSPAMSIRSALVALRSLLDDPCPDDALNSNAARDWRVAARTNNWEAYRRNVIAVAKRLTF